MVRSTELLDYGIIMNPVSASPFRWERVRLACGSNVLIWSAPFPSDANAVAIGMACVGFAGGFGLSAALAPGAHLAVYYVFALMFAIGLGVLYREGFAMVAQSRFRVLHPPVSGANSVARGGLEVSAITSLSSLRSALRSQTDLATLVRKRKRHIAVRSAFRGVWRPVYMPAKRINDSSTVARGRAQFQSGATEGRCFCLRAAEAMPDLLVNGGESIERVVVASAWPSSEAAEASDDLRFLVDYLVDYGLPFEGDVAATVYSSVVVNLKKWFRAADGDEPVGKVQQSSQ